MPQSNNTSRLICWKCNGTGYTHHYCGKAICKCDKPQHNVKCNICHGRGGFLNKNEVKNELA